MRTALCDQLEIEFPILAFSHCRDVVAAVSRAGGFGVLGALAFDAEQLEIELGWIDEHSDGRPYGVDVVIPQRDPGRRDEDPAALFVEIALVNQIFLGLAVEFFDVGGVPPVQTIGEYIGSDHNDPAWLSAQIPITSHRFAVAPWLVNGEVISLGSRGRHGAQQSKGGDQQQLHPATRPVFILSHGWHPA